MTDPKMWILLQLIGQKWEGPQILFAGDIGTEKNSFLQNMLRLFTGEPQCSTCLYTALDFVLEDDPEV